jgi:hypothetical protein
VPVERVVAIRNVPAHPGGSRSAQRLHPQPSLHCDPAARPRNQCRTIDTGRWAGTTAHDRSNRARSRSAPSLVRSQRSDPPKLRPQGDSRRRCQVSHQHHPEDLIHGLAVGPMRRRTDGQPWRCRPFRSRRSRAWGRPVERTPARLRSGLRADLRGPSQVDRWSVAGTRWRCPVCQGEVRHLRYPII